MKTETMQPIDQRSVSAQSLLNKEPQWMSHFRLQGLALAANLDLPHLDKTRLDRWNLNVYGSYLTSPKLESLNELPGELRDFCGENSSDNLIVQKNSNVIFQKLAEDLSRQGVIFMDLELAVVQHEELVKTYFMKAISQLDNKLTALHSATWNGGVFLYIPKNVKVEIPLQALFLSDHAQAVFAPHVLIVAEANSSVTYVENWISTGKGTTLSSGMVEVFVKQGANVQFASIHDMAGQTVDITYRRAIVDNDGHMEWILGELNSGNALTDSTSVLKGNGASSDAKVICVGKKKKKMNLTTRAIHFGRSSTSDMHIQAVLRDECTAIISGVTKIEKGATASNGQQTEKVLMLSPHARGDANPVLLIDEDDVKCNHAASVGQVNLEQVHYLMSRGIPKSEAQRLIIYGFLAPVVAQIPLEQLKGQLQQLVERKLAL